MEPSKSSCSTSMLFLNMFAGYDGVVGHLGKLHAEVEHEAGLQIIRVALCKNHDCRILQRQPELVYVSKQKQSSQSENSSKHFQKPTGHGPPLSIADLPRTPIWPEVGRTLRWASKPRSTTWLQWPLFFQAGHWSFC